MAYAKRYAGGFVDKPTLTTPIDSTFLNAVEAALLKLLDADPGVAGQVPIWTPGGNHYVPGLITNANIDPAAAIAKSKLAALSIVDADVAGGAAIAQSKIFGLATALAGIPPADGWWNLSALTYGTTDGHTFTVTYGGDLTATVPVGSRVKLTDAATVKYFIVTAHVAGTLTLYGGQNYALSAGAISNPFFSREKAPVGFPLNPANWTEELRDTANRSVATPAQNAWNNTGGLSLAVPIGAWDVYYEAAVQNSKGAEASADAYATLSTANNTESDPDFTAWGFFSTTATSTGVIHTFLRRKALALAAKTTYFLNLRWSNGAATATMNFRGDQSATIIRAVCAYL